MFNFKKRREEKQKMEDFKKSIKGIFNDWKIKNSTIDKNDYSLWIHRGYSNFGDYTGNFLECFSEKEKKLLWDEFQCRGFPDIRSKIFKEFNLKGGEDKNV